MTGQTYFCLESKTCPSSNRELIQDKPKVSCWSSFLGYPQVVTHVYVHGAEGLQNQDSTGGEEERGKARLYSRSANAAELSSKSFGCRDTGADPYVIIRCEGQSVRSTVRKDTLQPEFKTSGIFYRKKPTKPITVEVKHNTVAPKFALCAAVTELWLAAVSPRPRDHLPKSVFSCGKLSRGLLLCHGLKGRNHFGSNQGSDWCT